MIINIILLLLILDSLSSLADAFNSFFRLGYQRIPKSFFIIIIILITINFKF